MTFNFDEWADLYKTNPEEFERRRKAEIETVIESAPVDRQHGLRQLQWKVDTIRKTRPALQATITISKLMWERFYDLNDKLNDFSDIANEAVRAAQRPRLSIVPNTTGKQHDN